MKNSWTWKIFIIHRVSSVIITVYGFCIEIKWSKSLDMKWLNRDGRRIRYTWYEGITEREGRNQHAQPACNKSLLHFQNEAPSGHNSELNFFFLCYSFSIFSLFFFWFRFFCFSNFDPFLLFRQSNCANLHNSQYPIVLFVCS